VQNLVATATQHGEFVYPWFWSNLLTIHVQYTGIYICLVLLLHVSLPEHVKDHILIKILMKQNSVKLTMGSEICHEKYKIDRTSTIQ
jgi:hypothetical protein